MAWNLLVVVQRVFGVGSPKAATGICCFFGKNVNYSANGRAPGRLEYVSIGYVHCVVGEAQVTCFTQPRRSRSFSDGRGAFGKNDGRRNWQQTRPVGRDGN